jgi:uncharacterized protein (UPF0332 family)
MTDSGLNVAAEMDLAHEALTAANVLLSHGNIENSAVDRLYYACFHAARAVLYDRGFTPDSHQGVLSLFGRHVVQVGDATPEQGRFLNEMMRERLTADYEHAPVSIDLDEAYKRVERFLEEMQNLVDTESS